MAPECLRAPAHVRGLPTQHSRADVNVAAAAQERGGEPLPGLTKLLRASLTTEGPATAAHLTASHSLLHMAFLKVGG